MLAENYSDHSIIFEGIIEMAKVTLLAIQKFFEMSSADFRKEWQELTENDRKQIRFGFDSGDMDYPSWVTVIA